MIKHKDSHVDHGLTDLQLGYVMGICTTQNDHHDANWADIHGERRAIGVRTFVIELPEWLGTVPCGLYGPTMGDMPITGDAIVMGNRGTRKYESRLVPLPPRQTNKVTVIAGPHDGHDLVLYTAFGGPKAPREVGQLDVILADKFGGSTVSQLVAAGKWDEYQRIVDEKAQSKDFWSTHALTLEETKWFTWTAEFTVDKLWVADGFDLTDERAKQMLADDLSSAYGHEIKARVLKAPDADLVARTQGYASAADRAARSKR